MIKTQIDYAQPARTRIAPSPTGELGLHHLRQMLYDYALAKKTGGQFIFRIENTDQKRYVEGSAERMMDLTEEYGFRWDEGMRIGGEYEPYDQLSRVQAGMYSKEYDWLLQDGKVYRCFCTAEELEAKRQIAKEQKKQFMYDKTCRNLTQEKIQEKLDQNLPFTIRIKIPDNEVIEFHDLLRGKMSWKSQDVDDYILVKSDGVPTYHGAVVIDDYQMKITHVIRAAEWIPTTPVYVILARYLGYDLPMIIHPSVLLNPVGPGKMSKRKNGDLVFARSYIDKGYPPIAILNFLMFLGWSHPDEKVNILSLEDFCKAFVLERLQPQPSKVDFEKIDWYGGQYIRAMKPEELFDNIQLWLNKIQNPDLKNSASVWQDRIKTSPELAQKIVNLLQERLRKYSDLFEFGEFFYSRAVTDLIDWEKTKHSNDECLGALPGLKLILSKALDVEEDKNFDAELADSGIWTQDAWEKSIREYAEICGWKAGDMFMLLRLVIVGSPFSPNLLECMNLIGGEECLQRVEVG